MISLDSGRIRQGDILYLPIVKSHMRFEGTSGFLDVVDGRVDGAEVLILDFDNLTPSQDSRECVLAYRISLAL